MNQDSVAIIIPVYKLNPTESEISSFIQCLKVLSGYSIYLVTYKNLDLNVYKEIAESFEVSLNIKYFEGNYFSDIAGYNNLMLDKSFYQRFERYEYMLIYQLDAWVFKDELMDWCIKGYDYVGAPWFKNQGTHEEGESLWLVGNGGFSLRRTSYFITLLTSSKKLRSFTQLVKNCHSFSDWARLPLRQLGVKNNVSHLIRFFDGVFNEDLIYCMCLQNTQFEPKLPTPDEGIKFAFERSPSYLFELNNKELPFGCHAFEKNEFVSFWKKYM